MSLKDLLAIVAFVAVISWCAGIAGHDNGSFWFAIGAYGVIAAIFVGAARLKEGRWLALFTPALFLIPLVVLFSPGAVVNAVLLFVGGVVMLALQLRSTRVLCAFVMTCMAIALAADVREIRGRIRNLEELRREFPIVSLSNRLAYETRDDQGDDADSTATKAEQVALNGEVAAQLDEFEQVVCENNYREWELKAIHDRQYEKFVRSMGFGVMRMRRPYSESIRRSPLQDVAFNQPRSEESELLRDWDSPWRYDDSNSALHLHQVTRNDFVDPNGFGAVIQPRQAAGFVEHGMHHSPLEGLKDRDAWTIGRLELVSLLKFDEPRVYVLDHLPRMDQLSSDDVPTRALDEFEAGALEKLRTEEDIVVSNHGDEYRMLGSLRAAKQCLECHSVARGELLGAFTYVLRRGESGEVADER